MGLLSSIFGGNGAYKRARGRIDANRRMLESYYGSMANVDYAHTAEGASAVRRTKDAFDASKAQSAVQRGMTGGTDAGAYLEQEAANKALAEQQGQLAVASQGRRDSAMGGFIKAATAANDALNAVDIQQSQQEAAALGGLLNAGLSFASGGLSGAFGKKLNAKNG